MALLPPSRPSAPAVAAVVDELREWIVDGGLGEGTTLPAERVLAVQLGVSRPTLREGLAVLTQLGLVASRRGRIGGIRVTRPAGATVAYSVTLLCRTNAITAGQLTEVRRGLEIEAAQLAALRRSGEELREIEHALAAYVRTAADPVESNQHGRRLHYLVARASGNPLLVEVLASLDPAFADCVDLLWAMPGAHAEIECLHRPIVAAIAGRDAEAARTAMVRHFEQIERALVDHGLWARPLGRRTATSVRSAISPGRPRRSEGR